MDTDEYVLVGVGDNSIFLWDPLQNMEMTILKQECK